MSRRFTPPSVYGGRDKRGANSKPNGAVQKNAKAFWALMKLGLDDGTHHEYYFEQSRSSSHLLEKERGNETLG